jgi:glycosyltransferase involved in cell wall biosynthesis
MVLLEATRILARHRRDFAIWFVGQFAPAFERTARGFCREHGLDDMVSFLGPLTGDAKWDRFRRSHILCFPSFFESESFGNVAVEAMMFGLPVVGTRWRGIPDVIDDGVTGLFVPVQDAAALAGRSRAVDTRPRLRLTLGSAGRKKYLEEFTIERHLERLEEFLYDLGTVGRNSTRGLTKAGLERSPRGGSPSNHESHGDRCIWTRCRAPGTATGQATPLKAH